MKSHKLKYDRQLCGEALSLPWQWKNDQMASNSPDIKDSSAREEFGMCPSSLVHQIYLCTWALSKTRIQHFQFPPSNFLLLCGVILNKTWYSLLLSVRDCPSGSRAQSMNTYKNKVFVSMEVFQYEKSLPK